MLRIPFNINARQFHNEITFFQSAQLEVAKIFRVLFRNPARGKKKTENKQKKWKQSKGTS